MSITANSQEQVATAASQYQIAIPHLADADKKVSQAYGVLQWATSHGGPGHTFVLVDRTGKVLWIKDYGAKVNGGRMYVPVEELDAAIASAMGKKLPSPPATN